MLIELYGDWCLRHPAAFSPEDARTLPEPVVPPEVSVLVGDAREILHSHKEDDVRAQLPAILLSDDGLVWLWFLHEVSPYRGSRRAIYHYMPILEPLESVRRGGLNVYKRYSWTMHVLAAADVVWRCIPAGVLPPSAPDEARDDFGGIRDLYLALQSDARKLLRLGCILHDIGVRDGVEDHPRKGVPYVAGALTDFGGSQEFLIAAADIPTIIEAFVAEHTLLSKINGELSPGMIRNAFDPWVEKCSTDRAREFVRRELPTVLALFVSADLVAVDGKLLTARSVRRLRSAPAWMSALHPEREVDGAVRIANLLDEDDDAVRSALQERHRDSGELLEILAAADALDYAVGVLKPLRDVSIAVAILLTLARFWRASAVAHDAMRLAFSPYCHIETLREWGRRLLDDPTSSGAAADDHGIQIRVDNSTPPTLNISTTIRQA
jgi:hypothetical protein